MKGRRQTVCLFGPDEATQLHGVACLVLWWSQCHRTFIGERVVIAPRSINRTESLSDDDWILYDDRVRNS